MNKVQITQVFQKKADQLQKRVAESKGGRAEEYNEEGYDADLEQLRLEVYDIVKTIRDPEEPGTLEDLEMINEDLVTVQKDPKDGFPVIKVTWAPTNPDCKCALTIALCIRTKLFQQLSAQNAKIDIYVQEGKHSIKDQIDKQVCDKERVLAAMENESVVSVIADLIKDKPSH